jgi:RNA polymerase sigma factor (sigma-70 family)
MSTATRRKMSRHEAQSRDLRASAQLSTPRRDKQSDEVLLEQIRRGDEQALAQLTNRHSRAAFRLALRVIRDPNLAEDAVQDAFIDLWRKTRSYDANRSTALTWILTLVHRRAVDIVRHENHRRQRQGQPTIANPLQPSAEEAADLRHRRRLVQQALAQLPATERKALELAYYAGLTQSQIATHLGQPLGTTKARTFKGLRRLRRLLAHNDL